MESEEFLRLCKATHGLRQVGEVKGKKTVAKYMSQRADHAELIGQELLQEILREAGFDS